MSFIASCFILIQEPIKDQTLHLFLRHVSLVSLILEQYQCHFNFSWPCLFKKNVVQLSCWMSYSLDLWALHPYHLILDLEEALFASIPSRQYCGVHSSLCPETDTIKLSQDEWCSVWIRWNLPCLPFPFIICKYSVCGGGVNALILRDCLILQQHFIHWKLLVAIADSGLTQVMHQLVHNIFFFHLFLLVGG